MESKPVKGPNLKPKTIEKLQQENMKLQNKCLSYQNKILKLEQKLLKIQEENKKPKRETKSPLDIKKITDAIAEIKKLQLATEVSPVDLSKYANKDISHSQLVESILEGHLKKEL